MQKLRKFFLKKKFSSQMIQNCLIRREMAKKNWRQMAVFGGSGGTAAVFLKMGKIYVKIRLFSFLTYVLRLKTSLITTDYMKMAKLPLPPY